MSNEKLLELLSVLNTENYEQSMFQILLGQCRNPFPGAEPLWIEKIENSFFFTAIRFEGGRVRTFGVLGTPTIKRDGYKGDILMERKFFKKMHALVVMIGQARLPGEIAEESKGFNIYKTKYRRMIYPKDMVLKLDGEVPIWQEIPETQWLSEENIENLVWNKPLV